MHGYAPAYASLVNSPASSRKPKHFQGTYKINGIPFAANVGLSRAHTPGTSIRSHDSKADETKGNVMG